MSQETEKAEEKIPRSRVFVGLRELSSKQRGAVLGLIKDMGFVPEEIAEIVVQLPEEIETSASTQERRRKRK